MRDRRVLFKKATAAPSPVSSQGTLLILTDSQLLHFQ